MQVFVSGTWKAEKAEPYKDQARLLGQRLALLGMDLACGPGTGIARHVIDGYSSVGARGMIRYYLPSRSEMERVGEVVADGADDIVETDLDYPMRNLYQVKHSDGLFILTGGDGTLEEAIASLADYQLPVAAVRGSGTAAAALEGLLEIYPEWGRGLLFGTNVETLVDPFVTLVRQSRSC